MKTVIRPGVGRAHPAGDLEVLAQVDRGAEHGDADQHGRTGGEGRRTVAEEAQRDDRVVGDAGLDVDRRGHDRHAGEHQQAARRGGPAERVAGEGDPDQEDADAAHEERGAEVVDARVTSYDGQVQRLLQQDEGRDRDRDPDVEAPAPAQAGGVDDQAADERAADRGRGEDGADVAAVATALAWRDHARDHDLHQSGQAADAEALDGAGADQDAHVGGGAGDQRTGDVDDEGGLDQRLLGELVGELAPDRRRGRHREQGRDDDPGVLGLASVQALDDPRQRVGDDGAGEHGDEHREEEAGHGLEHLAVGHRARGLDRYRCRRGRSRRGCGRGAKRMVARTGSSRGR